MTHLLPRAGYQTLFCGESSRRRRSTYKQAEADCPRCLAALAAMRETVAAALRCAVRDLSPPEKAGEEHPYMVTISTFEQRDALIAEVLGNLLVEPRRA